MNRGDLRMALTAGLANGFATLSGLPFGYYMTLTVLAVGSDSYGGSLRLGRQRLLGSLLGSVLLIVGFRGLAGVPLPLGLAITVGAMRLLGGCLGLQVGYKVGGVVVVMGWLVHSGQLEAWVPLRLFWTALGVVVSLLSVRLFWPATGLDQSLASLRALLQDLQQACRRPSAGSDGRLLRRRLLALRRQRPTLAEELGTNADRHPAYRLMLTLDEATSRLITCLDGLGRRAPALNEVQLLERLHRAEDDLLQGLAERLATWNACLARHRPGTGLPPGPGEPFPEPASWNALRDDLSDPHQTEASLATLARIAGRLVLCRQARQAMVEAERQWHSLAR